MYEEIAAYNFAGIILATLLGFSILIGVLFLTSRRKTWEYRKSLTDLYVAAKVRFLATKDNLNLAEEYEAFKKWAKKKKIEYENYDLDRVIEEELKEQIQEPKVK